MSYDRRQLEKVKRGNPPVEVHGPLVERWSPRAFSNKPVLKADLKKMLSAATWAASAYNEQPWRFLIGIKADKQAGQTYEKILNSLGEYNQVWAKEAPVLIATAYKRTFTHKGTSNRLALHDLGAASANMCTQAIALGIHTHGMAGFDSDKLRASFSIPEDFEPGAVWAAGYLGEPDTLPSNYFSKEIQARTRKSLAEFAFAGWDEAIAFD